MNAFESLYLPLCYYPTKIAFVDDNIDYLNNLLIMFNDEFPCISFDDPHMASNAINESLTNGSFIDRCQFPVNKTSEQIVYKVDLKEIQREVFRKNRFDEISIVFVDYSMPSMNGLDFCRKFKGKDVIFFLLTGEADEKVALEAYGEWIIHGFAKKSSKNLREILLKAINDMQKRRFLNLSGKLLSKVDSDLFDFLKNEDVSKCFQKIYKENGAVEFYLVRDRGDFMLLDNQGIVSFLSLKSKKEFQNLYEQACIDEASSSTLLALKERRSIPIFYDSEDFTPWADEWEKYLCPAQKVPGNDEYYFAYKKALNREDLKKIVSYQEFLSNR
jgi:CheY-like chemotaxis protein